MTISRLSQAAILAIGLAMLAPAGALADAAEARAIAARHAGFAATAQEMDLVRLHLSHALNCLVGPDGAGFDEAAGYPCAQAGAAIPQTADAGVRDGLERAAAAVRAAVAETDMAAAKAAATEIQETLAAD